MKKTLHFQARQNQRGISQLMVDVVMAFGESSGDKLILNKKLAIQLKREVSFIIKQRKI